MSLLLRAHVAAAAASVVPGWPVESFIAVNPLAGHEPSPFHIAGSPGIALTRTRTDYLTDLDSGRITENDLAAALRERVPELGHTMVRVGGQQVSAARVGILDMSTAGWPAEPDRPTRSHAGRWLDEYLAAWIGAYLSPDPLWPTPHREGGMFAAWRVLARHDSSLPRAARRHLKHLPETADGALTAALDRVSVTPDQVRDMLARELQFLPGWVGYIKWRAEKVGDVDLTSYLAIRLTLRTLIRIPLDLSAATAPVDERAGLWQRSHTLAAQLVDEPTREDIAVLARVLAAHPVPEHRFTWQKAYELHYRHALVPTLRTGQSARDERTPAHVQVVMCIDPRSEGFRRHLETNPQVETFGFAGFFGVPVRFARFGARGAINSLPALLAPRHQLTEQPTTSAEGNEHIARGRARDALRQATHIADTSTATPFAFAETTGWLYGITSILRTFTPTLHHRLRRALTGTAQVPSTVSITDTFTLEERAGMAETAVRMMGMTDFAPLVVLAGHSSESANNLYQSALECGACGGNPGAANARAAAAIFNEPAVRDLLRTRGITIPGDTVFVAADHNTARDAITVLDHHLIPASHHTRVAEFDQQQGAAGEKLVRERAAELPGATAQRSVSRVRRRAHDWAEVYPELGLAGNAAMIIGPRTLTRGLHLNRRVFLHSYQTGLDPDGTALETIMTAPLVVAQWINHQYYFSALNPDTLGAGTKTIHNAIGTIGVIAGHTGDLRRGLPWQSVGLGTRLFHEPMRLTVIIQAPLDRIGDIISRNQVLRNLFDNDWITLTARTDTTTAWHRYTPYGWTVEEAEMEGH